MRKKTLRKRNRTPISARQKAVAYRHFPYKKARTYISETAENAFTLKPYKKVVFLEADTEVSENEDLLKDIEIPMTQKAKKVSVKIEETVPETKVENEQQESEDADPEEIVVEVPKRRKTRQEKENEIVENIAEEDTITLIDMIIHPLRTIRQAAESDNCTFSPVFWLFANCLKWLMIGALVAVNYAKDINKYAYSVNRMNFSQAALIAFEIGVAGIVIEIVTVFLSKFVAVAFKTDVWGRKIAWTQCRGSLFTAVVAAGCAVVSSSLIGGMGWTLCLSVLVLSAGLKIYAYTELFKQRKIVMIVMIILTILVEIAIMSIFMNAVFVELYKVAKAFGLVAH